MNNTSGAATSPTPPMMDDSNVDSQGLLKVVILQLCLFCLIAVVGFIGNILVLVAASQLRRQRSTRNTRSTYYIINLAIADLAIILVAMPTDLITYFTSWPFGEFSCKFIYPLRDVFVFVALITVTGLSIERYWVITGPFKTKPNPKHARIIIFCIWIIGYLFVGLPMVFVMKLVTSYHDENIVVCEINWNSTTEKRIHMLLSVICIILPSCVITFCYVRIAKALQNLQTRRSSESNIDGRPTSSVISLVAQSKKVAKMLVIIVVAFCCCILPLTLFAISYEFGLTTHHINFDIIYTLFISLFFAHSAVNPLVLIFMSKEYRLEVVRISHGLRDICWRSNIRSYLSRFASQKEYRQHKQNSDHQDHLVIDIEGQQRSTEL